MKNLFENAVFGDEYRRVDGGIAYYCGKFLNDSVTMQYDGDCYNVHYLTGEVRGVRTDWHENIVNRIDSVTDIQDRREVIFNAGKIFERTAYGKSYAECLKDADELERINKSYELHGIGSVNDFIAKKQEKNKPF